MIKWLVFLDGEDCGTVTFKAKELHWDKVNVVAVDGVIVEFECTILRISPRPTTCIWSDNRV